MGVRLPPSALQPTRPRSSVERAPGFEPGAQRFESSRGLCEYSRMASMKERMLRGELYIADDPELDGRLCARAGAPRALQRHARTPSAAERERLLRELLGEVGEGVVLRPPFRCDYGTPDHDRRGQLRQLRLRDARRRADPDRGAPARSRTCVQLLTATHPIDPAPRRARLGVRRSRSRSATTSGSAAARSSARASRSATTPSWAPARWSRATSRPASSRPAICCSRIGRVFGLPRPQSMPLLRGLRTDRPRGGRHHDAARSTRSSTPRTARCSAGAGSTARSTARAGRRSSRSAACSAAARPARRRRPDAGDAAGALRDPRGRPGLARRRRRRGRAARVVPPRLARARREPRLPDGRVPRDLDRRLRASRSTARRGSPSRTTAERARAAARRSSEVHVRALRPRRVRRVRSRTRRTLRSRNSRAEVSRVERRELVERGVIRRATVGVRRGGRGDRRGADAPR